ncbi:MAG: hypothetical protein M1556_01410 [Candidatus Thermoplasmatota archaeon]|jgi:hypothetical protein|nr:hypothetical protein [Candidatus Thermoplasmatota archaeon]MCL6002293.1 hypothetical protein [Candidatus Thermoplasmatota archaeon]
MIPIFVADRPFSLKILEGLKCQGYPFGILSHVFTSKNFKEKFKDFTLATIKVGDSGIYQGQDVSYEYLFSQYVKMGVSHGIIKDYYRDPELTLSSAKEAIKIHNTGDYNKSFELVGVAQGRSVEEYVESYRKQKKMGYEMVAIGGLLDKVQRHVRLVKVKREELLEETLRTIREHYPQDRLFPLGTFNRARIKLFKEVGVWGSDYKGWIFKYNLEESHIQNNRTEQTRNYIETKVFPILGKERLLILSCSDSKRIGIGKAIDIYDGPAYKIVRKYLRHNNGLDVRIISAKYGIISKDTLIEDYNERLTPEKASVYRTRYSQEIRTLSSAYGEVLIYGGSTYQSVFKNVEVKRTNGRIGEQLSQLKKWLYSQDQPSSSS